MRALVLAALLALTFPGIAEAKMLLRIGVTPAVPVAGERARVTVLTLAPFDHFCVSDPRSSARPWSGWHSSDPVRAPLRAEGVRG